MPNRVTHAYLGRQLSDSPVIERTPTTRTSKIFIIPLEKHHYRSWKKNQGIPEKFASSAEIVASAIPFLFRQKRKLHTFDIANESTVRSPTHTSLFNKRRTSTSGLAFASRETLLVRHCSAGFGSVWNVRTVGQTPVESNKKTAKTNRKYIVIVWKRRSVKLHVRTWILFENTNF